MFFKKLPAYIWVLIVIMLIGVVFRTYNIGEWLRFGPDQARDAGLVGNILKNGESLPLLGPQAGNTLFYLGPAYYWLGYASAYIFGANPPVFAYPIIFFSILSLPLLFYFLRQFFSIPISLGLSFFYAASYFAIINSRYASNTNLAPFFLLLFLLSIIKIIGTGNGKKTIWYIFWGISLGIGVQLHTLLFVSLPLISFLAFLYLAKKRSLKLAGISLTLIFFAIANLSQIVYDLRYQGANISGFFHGAQTQSGGTGAILRNIKLVGACQFQANAQIIFPLESRENCEILDISKNFNSNPNIRGEISGIFYLVELALVLAFSLGGYYLLFKYLFKKETPEKQKIFLAAAAVYNAVAFLIFIPVAGEIGARYFVILLFMPFLLLGLWFKAAAEAGWSAKTKKIIFGFLAAVLLFGNFFYLRSDILDFKSGKASDGRLSVLSEIVPIADYIADNSGPEKTAILDGERVSMDRFDKALMYLAAEKGVKISKSKSEEKAIRYFWIGLSEKGDGRDLVKKIKNHKILDSTRSGNIWVYILEN